MRRLSRIQVIHLFLLTLVGLLLLAVLAGCTTRQQRQDTADAIEGQKAAAALIRQVVERLRAVGQDVQPLTDAITILAGSTAHTHAIAEGASLPAPSVSADDIVRDPPSYQKHGEDADKKAAEGSSVWAYIGGGLLAALGVIRLIPGPSQALAETAWSLFSTRANKQQQAAYEDGHATAGFLLDVVHAMPANSTIGELRARIERTTAEPVLNALDRWAHENPADHVMSVAAPPAVAASVSMTGAPRA